MNEQITYERLREVLHYEPETGLFYWLVTARGGPIKGSQAGGYGSTGYWRIGIDGVVYKAHRLAWLYMHGHWPKGPIDHLNHDPADNRWANLRESSPLEQQRNRPRQKNNKSGRTGVIWNSSHNRWEARITVHKKQMSLGSFVQFEDAVAAREEAEMFYGFHSNHDKGSAIATDGRKENRHG